MRSERRGRWRGLWMGLILVAATACATATEGIPSSTLATPQPGTETVAESQSDQAPETDTADMAGDEGQPIDTPTGECGGMATMVAMNEPIDSVMFGTTQVLCVMVPDGVSQIVFELSDMTSALDLFVGYPDIATLEAGGDGFWASENGGREVESITIEPGTSGSVAPGPYFVEISGGSSADGASFVLTVSTS